LAQRYVGGGPYGAGPSFVVSLSCMKIHPSVSAALLGAALTLSGCASDESNQPAPGTLQSTDTKTSENNTPQTNPTPNPEPASNPPGPQSDMHPAGVAPQ
jgi:hypothetical protein